MRYEIHLQISSVGVLFITGALFLRSLVSFRPRGLPRFRCVLAAELGAICVLWFKALEIALF
jgi:hypothetical protein